MTLSSTRSRSIDRERPKRGEASTFGPNRVGTLRLGIFVKIPLQKCKRRSGVAAVEVTVEVGDLCLKSVSGEGEDRAELSKAFSRAIRHYLDDRDSGRIAWPYPRSLAGEAGSQRAVTVEVDGQVWAELVTEAERQEVTPDQLVGHALLYLAADLDSGRLT
jgi:hypothetical protein